MILPMNEVVVVRADDWSGIYINGYLQYEGHSIDDDYWISLLKRAGVNIFDDNYESDEAYKVIQNYGRCPQTINEWIKLAEEQDD